MYVRVFLILLDQPFTGTFNLKARSSLKILEIFLLWFSVRNYTSEDLCLMPFIFPPKFKSCFVEVVSSWVSLWIINRHKEMRKPSVRSMYEAEWLLSCFGATRESSIIQGSLKDQNGQGLVSGIQITSAMLVPPRELVQILQRKKELDFTG